MENITKLIIVFIFVISLFVVGFFAFNTGFGAGSSRTTNVAQLAYEKGRLEKTGSCVSKNELPDVNLETKEKLLKVAKLPLYRARPNTDQNLFFTIEQKAIAKKFTYEGDGKEYIMLTNAKGEKIFTLGSAYSKYLYRQDASGQKQKITMEDVRGEERVTLTETYDINTQKGVRYEVLFYE